MSGSDNEEKAQDPTPSEARGYITRTWIGPTDEPPPGFDPERGDKRIKVPRRDERS